MSIKVALVVPPSDKIAEKKDTPCYQHVGIGYLAAMCQKQGISVTVVNAKLERMGYGQVVDKLEETSADIFGFTAMTHEINMAHRLAQRVKLSLPQSVTVIGGVHATALPADTLRQFPGFDIGIAGEGDYSFLEVIRIIEKGQRDFSRVQGAVFRSGSQVLMGSPAQRIPDLDALPFPAWQQFPSASEYIIISSRGCPFGCIFCMRALGAQVRKRSPHNVVEEIEQVIIERMPERFLFYDETLTLDKNHAYAICDLLMRKGLQNKIRWSATTRVDSVDEDLLLKMRQAGCDHIEFGVESGEDDVLRRIKKGITTAQAENAVALAKKLGFHTETAFILGHPNETLSSAYRTISFAAKLNADIVQLGIMVPYPGTEVARLAEEGRGGYKIISRDWSEYNKQLGNALELECLSRKDLERLQLIGYIKLFVYNKRVFDLFRFLWEYRREMVSFLRNHLRKQKQVHGSRIGIAMMIAMIFKKSPVFVSQKGKAQCSAYS